MALVRPQPGRLPTWSKGRDPPFARTLNPTPTRPLPIFTVISLASDVDAHNAVDSVFKDYGKLDVMFSNVGITGNYDLRI